MSGQASLAGLLQKEAFYQRHMKAIEVTWEARRLNGERRARAASLRANLRRLTAEDASFQTNHKMSFFELENIFEDR